MFLRGIERGDGEEVFLCSFGFPFLLELGTL